jgi:hypothetical protein
VFLILKLFSILIENSIFVIRPAKSTVRPKLFVDEENYQSHLFEVVRGYVVLAQV